MIDTAALDGRIWSTLRRSWGASGVSLVGNRRTSATVVSEVDAVASRVDMFATSLTKTLLSTP
jgi:hypothetical protein